MQLVYESSSVDEARALSRRLERGGIPSCTSGGGEHEEGSVSVWIYLDHQFDDATRLVQDSRYVVRRKVDLDSFYRALSAESSKQKIEARFDTFISIIVVVCALFFLFASYVAFVAP